MTTEAHSKPADSVWLYLEGEDGEVFSLPCTGLEDALFMATGAVMYTEGSAKPVCVMNRSHHVNNKKLLVSYEGLQLAINEPDRIRRVKGETEKSAKPTSFYEFMKNLTGNIPGFRT